MSSVPSGRGFDAPARGGNALKSWWQALAHREQRVLTLGAATVAAVLVYLVLWEPAADGVRRLNVDLPQLRAQSSALRQMADEATRLRGDGASSTPVAPDDRVAAVRRSLDRAGLARASAPAVAVTQGPMATLSTNGLTVIGGTATQAGGGQSAPDVIAEAGGRVRVRFDNVDYGIWIAWLTATEAELSARVSRVSANAVGGGALGRVRTDVLFDWSPGPAAPRGSA